MKNTYMKVLSKLWNANTNIEHQHNKAEFLDRHPVRVCHLLSSPSKRLYLFQWCWKSIKSLCLEVVQIQTLFFSTHNLKVGLTFE